MSEELEKATDGAGLWARARAGWRDAVAAPEAPDPLTLAAYLDGTLEEATQERVEAWMATSSEALDLVMALREAGAPEAVPESLLTRAQGLVRERPGAARAGLGAVSRSWERIALSWADRIPFIWPIRAASVLSFCSSGLISRRLAGHE